MNPNLILSAHVSADAEEPVESDSGSDLVVEDVGMPTRRSGYSPRTNFIHFGKRQADAKYSPRTNFIHFG